jgi:hypothetical protein
MSGSGGVLPPSTDQSRQDMIQFITDCLYNKQLAMSCVCSSVLSCVRQSMPVSFANMYEACVRLVAPNRFITS